MTKGSNGTSRRIAAGVGGDLSLEFVNTVAWHLSDDPVEKLSRWRDVVSWMKQLGLISAGAAKDLAKLDLDPQRLQRLREDVFQCGVALARGKRPDERRLARIVKTAQTKQPNVLPSKIRLSWHFSQKNAAGELAAIIARAALSLFCSERATKIRVCEGGECGWLFVDESRTARRRWCSMSDCGARAKAKRHYSRSKSEDLAA